MAISSYGNYRNQKKKNIIYYIIAAAIIAAVVALFLYPAAKKTKQDTAPPAQQDSTGQNQTALESRTAEIKPAPAEPVSQTEPAEEIRPQIGDIAATAQNQAGPQVAALIKDAQQSIAEEKIIAARDTLNDVLNMAMTDELRQKVKLQMQQLAQKWLFTRTVLFGDNLCSTYKVQPGDMLSSIAAKHKVPYQFLMEINNIPNERSLRAGQVIKVVHGPFHAIAYKSAFTMDLYLQNVYVKSYKMGIGKDGHETPSGLWRAEPGGKLIKPRWTDPETGKTYESDDPDYPLGSGWIALEGIDSRTRGIQGIAIHGTKDETTIGTKSSRGCIRLYNGELIELYNMFAAGYSELRITE